MTPRRAIALQVGLTCLLAGLDFTSIITIDNFFSAGQGMLEFLACIKLRMSHPDLPRPFRVPLGTRAALSAALRVDVAVMAAARGTPGASLVTLVTASLRDARPGGGRAGRRGGS